MSEVRKVEMNQIEYRVGGGMSAITRHGRRDSQVCDPGTLVQ